MTSPDAADATRPRWWRVEVRYGAELLGLCALAVAQPLLDVFGKTPDVFIFRQASSADIVLFGLMVTFAPPLALWAVSAPFGFVGPRARRTAHLVVAAPLVAAFVLVAGRNMLGGAAQVALSVAAAAIFVLGYVRSAGVRAWLVWLAPAAPVFLLVFLTTSDASALFSKEEGGEQAAGGGAHPPVVWIMLDELPLRTLLDEDGKIDADLYPNLAALAGDSRFYRNTTSTAGTTWYAVPTMLTGSEVPSNTAPTVADHPDNVFTAFSGAYDVEAVETLSRLCPLSVCDPLPVPGVASGLGPLLDDARAIYRDLVTPGGESDPVSSFLEETVPVDDRGAVAPGTGDFEASQPARYAEFLDRLQPSDDPTFWYLHLLMPHQPWRFTPSGVEYAKPDEDWGRFVFNWIDEEAPVDLARQRHVLQVQYADELVGGVLDRLRELGLYDEAVVVVTSDHGVAFTPGEPVRGTEIDADVSAIWPELMWVPFLVKPPADRADEVEAGSVSDQNVLITDVLPTVADLADLDLPFDVEGRSVVSDPPRTAGDKPFAPVEISAFGNFLGPRAIYDGREGLAAALADPVAAFLPDRRDAALRPYRLGRWGGLVGEPVADLQVSTESAGGVELELGDGLASPDPSRPLEALVGGHLVDVDGPATVVVAVNGTIAGVASTFPHGGSSAFFGMMVPEQLLRPDRNTLELYTLTDPLDAPVLTPLTIAG